MKCRVFCSWLSDGFWSFAPFMIYGGRGYFGIGVLSLVVELKKHREWEF